MLAAEPKNEILWEDSADLDRYGVPVEYQGCGSGWWHGLAPIPAYESDEQASAARWAGAHDLASALETG